MLDLTAIFLIIALIAGILGLVGVAGLAVEIAKTCYVIFLVLFFASVLLRITKEI